MTSSLVAGGAGFIGSHLVDALIARGETVYCIDNLISGSKHNIDHLKKHPRFHFFLHDVTLPLPSSLRSALSDVSRVYHLASPASPPLYQAHAVETLMVNSIGTKHLLDIARETSSRFLITSTSEVYGNPLVHPQPETYYGNVNPHGVRACYDEGKRFSEALTMEYVRHGFLDGRIARIFNTYGPRMHPADGRVVSNFISQALRGESLTVYGDGSQTRSFCYVSDMVRGLLALMDTEGLSGEVINIGYPKEHTVQEIADIIKKEIPSSGGISYHSLPSDDPVKRRPDIGKAQTMLGWSPMVSLSDGLKEMISYYRKNMPELP